MSDGAPIAESPPPRSLAPGDIPPGDIPPGDIPPGDIPPGDIPPGDIPPRAVTILCCALVALPFVVSAVAAAVGGWRPSWDTAFIQLRVLDVGTVRTPLIGMPSTVSQSLAATAHHPGPMHFWLLALPNLFTRWTPAGLAVAQAVVNAALAVLSLLAARATGGTRAMWSAVALWLVAAVLMGDEMLHDPWNPHMATIALLAAAISAAAVWQAESSVAIVSLIVSASAAAQSHLSGLIPAAALVIAAAGCVARRRGWRSSRGYIILGAISFVVCWSGPLLDQLLHRPGNLRTLLTAGDSLGASFGFIAGIDRLARAVTPPGLIRSGVPSVMTGAGLWVGRIVLVALVAVLISSIVHRTRRGNRSTAAPIALVLAAATWIGQSITPVTFGSVFGRHMWELMWPASIAIWAAVCAVAVEVIDGVHMRLAHEPSMRHQPVTSHEPVTTKRLATGQRFLRPAMFAVLFVGLIGRPMVTDVESQRDGRWFEAIATAADAFNVGRSRLTIVTSGVAIESELVAGVAADLARRGADIRFTGQVSSGLLHSRRLVTTTIEPALLFSTAIDDPLAEGRPPLLVIESPVPIDTDTDTGDSTDAKADPDAASIHLFLIRPTK
jgi:hypothetical protein